MSGYLEHVKAQSEILASQKVVNSCHSALTWSERMTPLEDRLANLLSSMPSDVIENGLSLDAVRRLLSGKWRGNCHPGELGAAFRKLGYERRRSWSDPKLGFKSLWFR